MKEFIYLFIINFFFRMGLKRERRTIGSSVSYLNISDSHWIFGHTVLESTWTTLLYMMGFFSVIS